MNIFRNKKDKWEMAIFQAGVELGMREQQRFDSTNGTIIGLPSAQQIEQQVTEILNRKGF